MKQESLTRTLWSTLRWYLTTIAGRIATVGLCALIVGGAAFWQWPAVTGATQYVVSVVSAAVLGEEIPAPGDPEPVDPEELLAAQSALFDQLIDSRAAVTAASAFPELAGQVSRLEYRIDTCDKTRSSALQPHVFVACAWSLAQLSGPLAVSTEEAAVLAEAEAKRKAEAEAEARRPTSRPANPAPPPVRVPTQPSVPQTATTVLNTVCVSDGNTITYSATGKGTVTITASGAASGSNSGSVSTSLTVSGNAGTYRATATGSGGEIHLNASISGSCS